MRKGGRGEEGRGRVGRGEGGSEGVRKSWEGRGRLEKIGKR